MELFTPRNQFNVTGIVSALEKKVPANFSFIGESHPCAELVYLRRGELEVVEDERSYSLESGQLICHMPGEFHRIRCAGKSGAEFCVLSFAADGMLPRDIGSGVFALDKEMQQAFETLFERLMYFIWERTEGKPTSEFCVSDTPHFRTVGNPDKLGQQGLALLTAFLIALSYEESMTQSATVGRMGDYSALVRLMTDEVDRGLSLSDLAALHHSSTSYITKLFLEYAGEGPMHYYSRLRLERARRLLMSGYGVAQVSEMMCFSSCAYFSSFFKERTGLPPSEWVKSNRS